MQQLSEKTDCERNRTADDKQQKHSAALLVSIVQRKSSGMCPIFDTVPYSEIIFTGSLPGEKDIDMINMLHSVSIHNKRSLKESRHTFMSALCLLPMPTSYGQTSTCLWVNCCFPRSLTSHKEIKGRVLSFRFVPDRINNRIDEKIFL